jgi:hypothetical protein
MVNQVTNVDNSVPSGAIAAAMRAIEGLHGRDYGDDLDFQIMLRTDLDTWGRANITKAFMLLIGVAFDVIKTPPDEPVLRHRIVGAAVNQLCRMEFDEIPEADLPTVAGGLTAAALGQDVHSWRVSLGPIPDKETIVWGHALFVLVGFVDDTIGEGVFAQMVANITEGNE